MVIHRSNIRRLLCTAAFLLTAAFLHADEPPLPAPTPTPPAAPSNPTPVPTAPNPAPPAVLPRREDEPANSVAGQTAVQPSALATRISASLSALRGNGAQVQQLAARDLTIQQQLTQIQQLTAERDRMAGELAQYRTDFAALEQALQQSEGRAASVEDGLAALGFQSSKLPAQAALEHVAANSMEDLQQKFAAEQDPARKAELAAQMIALRDKKA